MKPLVNILKAAACAGMAWMLVASAGATPGMAQPAAGLMFVENVGQFDAPARFQTLGGPAVLSVSGNALRFTLLEQPPAPDSPAPTPDDLPATVPEQGVNIQLSFVNANPAAVLEPFNRLDTRVSYFTGNNPANWYVDAPVWGGVRYVDLYPGINLELTGKNGRLTPRLVVSDPAGNSADMSAQATSPLSQVAIQVEGANSVSIDSNGQLRLSTGLGELALPLLSVEQAGMQAASVMAPRLEGNVVRQPFTTRSGPPAAEMQAAGALDLLYSTFLGGSGNLDAGRDIAVDAAGHAYISGQAYSGFPTTPGAFDTSIEGVEGDAFVARLSPDGSTLEFATFLGGSDFDTALSIVLDNAGTVYLGGYTVSTDFPVTPGVFDSTYQGYSEAYVAHFNADGTALLYSTFLGGSNADLGWSIAVDSAGSAYITGFTESPDFPTTPGAFDTTLAEWYDIFVAKLSPDATTLEYGTLVGGNSADYSFGGIAVDSAGNAYVSGYTHSTDFPVTPGAFDTTYNSQEAFIFKLNPTGSDMVYATFLGGSSAEYAQGTTVDAAGYVYVTGTTSSEDFPVTPDALDSSLDTPFAIASDVFVAKLAPDGSTLDYATYLGGQNDDVGYDLKLDGNGNIYITGETSSPDFPTTPGAYDTVCNSCNRPIPLPDIFIARLGADGRTLAYATFMGGNNIERSYALGIDAAGIAYVTGNTFSTGFPVSPSAFDTVMDGSSDSFVAGMLVGEGSGPGPSPTPVPPHNCAPTHLGDITVGDTPRGLAVDSTRRRVYVANSGSHSVSVIDSDTNTVINTITGLTSANGLALDTLHNVLWVSNTTANQVTPVEINANATSFTVLPAVDTGAGPWGVAYSQIYNMVYVANSLDDTVSVIDATAQTVVATLTGSFSRPFHMAASPVTGKVYVTNFNSNSVAVIAGSTVARVVDLYDSAQPYGIAVDEQRNLVYVATVAPNRIVAIGPLNGVDDQFLGWAAFYRGFGNRNRPVPMRVIAVNPGIGPAGDGGHVWSTTSTADGSELNQALLIPKGWTSYFHYPLAHNVGDNPAEGIAIDRITNRVYVSSGASPGMVTVLGDHASLCAGVSPADTGNPAGDIGFDLFTRDTLSRGDVTGDAAVDILDLAFLAARYRSTDPAADVNGDGQVDILDLAIVARNYGQVFAGNSKR